jgi:multiple antibiotic resistance protein
MKEALSFAIIALPSLIVITNPLLVTSVFITLTASYPPEARKALARRTTIVAFAVLMAFAIGGTLLFKMFSITIGAFQIAGGIILSIVAVHMLNAQASRTKQTPEEMDEAMSKNDIAVVPLAIPMTSGPGAITAVIMLAGDAKDAGHIGVLLISIVITMIVIFAFLRNASRVQRFLGPSGLNIATRLMGLILAAIAVQFIINGAKSVLPDILKGIHC